MNKKRGQATFLFLGIFGRDVSLFEEVSAIMKKKFGQITIRSKLFDFTHTDYYALEMGENLKKMFFVFKKPIAPDRLIDIKLYTMKLEAKFSKKGDSALFPAVSKRRVNLDPGYLSLSKVVLATHKDYCHRLYLGKDIYGEVTLFFKDRTFSPFPWTFPDFRTPEYINFFNGARKVCYNKPCKGGA